MNDPIKEGLSKLTVGGEPFFVKTAKERMRAYSYAETLKIKIASRAPLLKNGFNIFRIK